MQGGKSRAEERREAYPNDPLPLPEIDCPELADFLLSAGPAMAGGMGDVPLTAQELTAWSDGAGVQLTAWEFRSILAASEAYTSEKYAAKDATRPSPTAPKLDATQKAAVASSIKKLLRD